MFGDLTKSSELYHKQMIGTLCWQKYRSAWELDFVTIANSLSDRRLHADLLHSHPTFDTQR